MRKACFDGPYKVITHQMDVMAVATLDSQVYDLKDINDDLRKDAVKVLGIFHRVPDADARTAKKKPLIGSKIFHGSHLRLKNGGDNLIIDMPLERIGVATGGEFDYWAFDEAMDFDLMNSKSSILNAAASADTDTAAGAGQQYELGIVISDVRAC